MTEQAPVPLRPAATILLLRDSADGIEVFMVVRNHQIDFAAGALVFPGGTTDPGDSAPQLRAYCDGAEGLDDTALTVRIAGIREAFEEACALLARPAGSAALIEPARAAALGEKYRTALEAGEIDMLAFCQAENVRLAIDCLAPFAHWLTPVRMPKRFDTYFFLAAVPKDAGLRHDGQESVESVWITPAQALADEAAGSRTIVFPTRLNLEKLGRCKTVAEAIAAAHRTPVVSVMPTVERHPDGRTLHIPEAAGYGQTSYFFKS